MLYSCYTAAIRLNKHLQLQYTNFYWKSLPTQTVIRLFYALPRPATGSSTTNSLIMPSNSIAFQLNRIYMPPGHQPYAHTKLMLSITVILNAFPCRGGLPAYCCAFRHSLAAFGTAGTVSGGKVLSGAPSWLSSCRFFVFFFALFSLLLLFILILCASLCFSCLVSRCFSFTFRFVQKLIRLIKTLLGTSSSKLFRSWLNQNFAGKAKSRARQPE